MAAENEQNANPPNMIQTITAHFNKTVERMTSDFKNMVDQTNVQVRTNTTSIRERKVAIARIENTLNTHPLEATLEPIWSQIAATDAPQMNNRNAED